MSVKSDVGQFAMVPVWLLEIGISARAIHLFAILSGKYADRTTHKSFPSRQTLAENMGGCSTDTVDRAVKELVKAGALELTRRKEGKEWLTSVYLVRYVRQGSRMDAPTPSRMDAEQNQNQLEPESLNQNDSSTDVPESLAKPAKKKQPVPYSEELKQTLMGVYSDIPDVAFQIDLAMDQAAAKKHKDMNLYLRNWLNRTRQSKPTGFAPNSNRPSRRATELPEAAALKAAWGSNEPRPTT